VFEQLYHQTFRRLSQYVLFKAGNISDTEDIVAAAYTAYYQHIVQRGHDEPANPYAYLVRMANHGLGRLYKERQTQISFMMIKITYQRLCLMIPMLSTIFSTRSTARNSGSQSAASVPPSSKSSSLTCGLT